MNRINPLYIGVLFIGILLFLLFQLSGAKSDLAEAKEEYKSTELIVNELRSLKNIYGNKKKIEKSISRLLNQASLKSAKIQKRSMKNGVAFSSESMDKKALDSLMGKILNGTYNVEKLKIKKLSKEKVSFEMEIKW